MRRNNLLPGLLLALALACQLTGCRPARPSDARAYQPTEHLPGPGGFTPTPPAAWHPQPLTLWQALGQWLVSSGEAKKLRAAAGAPAKVKGGIYVAPGAHAQGLAAGRNTTAAAGQATAAGKKAGPVAGAGASQQHTRGRAQAQQQHGNGNHAQATQPRPLGLLAQASRLGLGVLAAGAGAVLVWFFWPFLRRKRHG